jgi:hypothetical protein
MQSDAQHVPPPPSGEEEGQAPSAFFLPWDDLSEEHHLTGAMLATHWDHISPEINRQFSSDGC